MESTLDTVRLNVKELAAKINVPGYLLPTFGYTEDGARPYIEIKDGKLFYVIVERGQEQKRESARDIDDLLYKIFTSVTFAMASDFELQHRIFDKDQRRQIFEKQTELLEELKSEWGVRIQQEHAKILKSSPYDDYSATRAAHSKELRESGYSPEESWRMACEKYPLP